jgi:hypothetical protein
MGRGNDLQLYRKSIMLHIGTHEYTLSSVNPADNSAAGNRRSQARQVGLISCEVVITS